MRNPQGILEGVSQLDRPVEAAGNGGHDKRIVGRGGIVVMAVEKGLAHLFEIGKVGGVVDMPHGIEIPKPHLLSDREPFLFSHLCPLLSNCQDFQPLFIPQPQ